MDEPRTILDDIVDDVENGTPYIFSKDGAAVAVLMSFNERETLEQKLARFT